MSLQGQGEKQMFTCLCGYKEKLSSFQERRKKEGAGVSKKDVASYKKKMQQEERSTTTAFADALSKIEL